METRVAGADDHLDIVAVIDEAMDMIADKGWSAFTVGALADVMDIAHADLSRQFPTKLSILDVMLQVTDREILDNMDPQLREEPVKDRIFELVMLRFDSMQRWKSGIARMVTDLPSDPLAAAALAALLGRSFAAMLEAAGQSFTGIAGAIRMNGLGLIYLATMRVWLQDDSPDFSQTMSELDRRLSQADLVLRRILNLPAENGAAQK